MFHSPNRTRIPDVAVLRSQPKTWVRFPFRTALRIPMLIPVYAVSSCYNPAIVDESTTTRNPPGQITGLDDRRLLHHHDSYLGNVKQKLVYPFIENENCRHNLSCFFFLPAMELFRSLYRDHRRYDSYECTSVRILKPPNELLSRSFDYIFKAWQRKKVKKLWWLFPIFDALKV